MKLKIALYTLVAGTVLTSCSKGKLSPVPQTFLSEAVAFSDSARCVQQVNGLYSAIKQGQMLAGRYMVYQDVRGEEFLNVTDRKSVV